MNWIIANNINYYDAINALKNLKKVNWNQSADFMVGDIIYIYTAKPISRITIKTEVVEIDLKKRYIDDSKYIKNGQYFLNYGNYMTLKFIKEVHNVTLVDLKKLGIYLNFRQPIKLKTDIESKEVIKEKDNQIEKPQVFIKPKKIDSNLALVKNLCIPHQTTKVTEEEFLNLVDWNSYKPKKGKKSVKVDDRFVLSFDSEDERIIYDYIKKNKLAKIIRGQALKIPIPHTKTNYYPDLIYLNQDNEVVIVEVKSKSNMSTIDELKKYDALKKYCNLHGFYYTMIDRNFTSIKSLCNIKYSKTLEDKVIAHIKRYCLLDSQAVTEIREKEFQHIKRKDLDKQISAIIIKNKYIDKKVNMNQLHVINKKFFLDDICAD